MRLCFRLHAEFGQRYERVGTFLGKGVFLEKLPVDRYRGVPVPLSYEHMRGRKFGSQLLRSGQFRGFRIGLVRLLELTEVFVGDTQLNQREAFEGRTVVARKILVERVAGLRWILLGHVAAREIKTREAAKTCAGMILRKLAEVRLCGLVLFMVEGGDRFVELIGHQPIPILHVEINAEGGRGKRYHGTRADNYLREVIEQQTPEILKKGYELVGLPELLAAELAVSYRHGSSRVTSEAGSWTASWQSEEGAGR